LASKFRQTTNKTLQKKISTKFEIFKKKMQTFILSSNMKNEQQITFTEKLQAKEGPKIKLLMLLCTHTRLISMMSDFFWRTFFAIFSKVLYSV